jgi:ABC-type transport system involved in multi-copper enzyme maturation permease subunit
VRVTWLQQRTALVGLSFAFSVLAILIIVGASEIHGKYASIIAAGCVSGRFSGACASNFFANNEDFFSNTVIALRVLPVVVGVFLGAPLIARELESGTFRFSWTQTVRRTRQIFVMFAVLAGFLIITTVILGLLIGWFAHPFEVSHVESRWSSGLFEDTPLVLAGWTTFAFALGVFVGAVIARTVVAMAAAAVVAGGLTLGSTFVFVHRLLSIAPVVASPTVPVTNPGLLNYPSFPGNGLPGSWLVRAWYTGPHGTVLTNDAAVKLQGAMFKTARGKPDPGKWLSLHHDFYSLAYQPASRFGIFQGVEVIGLFGLAGVLLVAAAWRVRRG